MKFRDFFLNRPRRRLLLGPKKWAPRRWRKVNDRRSGVEGGRKRTKEKTGTKERGAPMAIVMIVVVARRAKHSSRFKSAMRSPLSFFPSFLPSLPTDQLAVRVFAPSELYFRGIRMTTAALRDLATWPTFPLPSIPSPSDPLLVAMAVATLALFT